MTVVDEIKDRLDIVEVVSSYVQLQKSGRNFKALCPFHSEKTASFVVFPESQHWHCFGACSEGGDVFTFVMKQEGWDFRTAMQELARRAGVELQPRTPAQEEADDERDRMREVLAAASSYFNHCLRQAAGAEAARAYVAGRGLSEQTVERFQLGYSPAGWDTTMTYLTQRGFTTKELIQAGLLVEREDTGTVYDRFRQRLMIPIHDGKGRVIGFGARTLDPAGVPKYLNSPQTPVFDKSQTLFGLDKARRAIRRQDQAVIVEGYMDVMQAHQAGFENVVAQMGTALTESQLRELQRYATKLILALDPDAAGVQATLRGVEVARDTLDPDWQPVFDPRGLVGYEAKLGTEIRVLHLPAGKDPDELILEDRERWSTLVERALPVVDFYLLVLLEGLDLGDTKAKGQVVDTLVPILQAVANPVELDDYVQKIARALRVDTRAVSARLRTPRRDATHRRRGSTQGAGAPIHGLPHADLESHYLSLLLERPALLSRVDQILESGQLRPAKGEDLEVPANRMLFETWVAVLATDPPSPLEDLVAQLPEDLRSRVDELAPSDYALVSDDQLARDAVRTILRLRQRKLKQLGTELRLLLVESREAGDARAAQYDGAQMAFGREVLKTQKALASLGIG